MDWQSFKRINQSISIDTKMYKIKTVKVEIPLCLHSVYFIENNGVFSFIYKIYCFIKLRGI